MTICEQDLEFTPYFKGSISHSTESSIIMLEYWFNTDTEGS